MCESRQNFLSAVLVALHQFILHSHGTSIVCCCCFLLLFYSVYLYLSFLSTVSLVLMGLRLTLDM